MCSTMETLVFSFDYLHMHSHPPKQVKIFISNKTMFLSCQDLSNYMDLIQAWNQSQKWTYFDLYGLHFTSLALWTLARPLLLVWQLSSLRTEVIRRQLQTILLSHTIKMFHRWNQYQLLQFCQRFEHFQHIFAACLLMGKRREKKSSNLAFLNLENDFDCVSYNLTRYSLCDHGMPKLIVTWTWILISDEYYVPPAQ